MYSLRAFVLTKRRISINSFRISDQISLSVVSDSLRPHESQHARIDPKSPFVGSTEQEDIQGSFTLAFDAAIFRKRKFSLRSFHEGCDHWRQDRQTTALLCAPCSLGPDHHDKRPRRRSATPKHRVRGWGRGWERLWEQAPFSAQNSQLCWFKKKKKFFSKTPVGKFELPTAPQGHLELAVEPFLWISVKF